MSPNELSRDELMTMLFAEMVVQQTNMAMIFLGKTAHPQTGKTHKDLDAARLFIDQLEMLEVKTRGNLTKEEDSLLKQSLSHLRMTYVEAASEQQKTEPPKATEPSEAPKPAETPAAPEAEEEHRKRFTKKY
ncbi:MAG TPA: DUF1844 domain-containing protein [Verrucomicrobiae bacterium]|nr:DUF1844 domain-containing protein [Verrucomicrobiae bacterium]